MFERAIWDKLPQCIFKNFEVFKNHEGGLPPKSPETNMWLLVNHIELTKTFYWNWYLLRVGKYKSASGQLQNNAVNGACQFQSIVWFIKEKHVSYKQSPTNVRQNRCS